jgi:hypothetical protein
MRVSPPQYAPGLKHLAGWLHRANAAHRRATRQEPSSDSENRDLNLNRTAQQLAWILIWVLISLYLATSYMLWAKIESAWPIFRGFIFLKGLW